MGGLPLRARRTTLSARSFNMEANAPYLPPPAPSDNPTPKKKGSAKTLLLWVFLVLMFVSIYQLLSGPTHHAGPPPPEPPSSPWTSAMSGLVPAIVLAGLVLFWLRRQFRGGAKLNGRLEPGHLALADGDLGRAAEVYSAVAHDYRKQTSYTAVAKLSLVTTLMRQGELERAIAVAVEVERAPGLLFGSELRLNAAIDLALLHALAGRLEVAERWSDDARRRLGYSHNRTFVAALLRVTELLVLARQGRCDDAARLFDRDARRLDESLTVAWMRVAWLVRAFAAAGDGARGSVEPWVTLARSGRRGELRWLGVAWPELRAFVDAHEL
jgi:hypothetical protein